MAARTPARRGLSSTVAAITRHNGPDDPRIPELQRDLRAAELEDHIRQLVDEAPPLTAEQRLRLAGLLVGGIS